MDVFDNIRRTTSDQDRWNGSWGCGSGHIECIDLILGHRLHNKPEPRTTPVWSCGGKIYVDVRMVMKNNGNERKDRDVGLTFPSFDPHNTINGS